MFSVCLLTGEGGTCSSKFCHQMSYCLTWWGPFGSKSSVSSYATSGVGGRGTFRFQIWCPFQCHFWWEGASEKKKFNNFFSPKFLPEYFPNIFFLGGGSGNKKIRNFSLAKNAFCGGPKKIFCHKTFFCNFFFFGVRKFFGGIFFFFFWAQEVEPEVNQLEDDPEGGGVGGTPLAVMQEDCLVSTSFFQNTTNSIL